MNLKDLYKPIGRLYEEVPSADYAGDYLAANGGWNNVVNDDKAVQAMRDEIDDLIKQLSALQIKYTDIKVGTSNCDYSRWRKQYECPDLKIQYGDENINVGSTVGSWVDLERFRGYNALLSGYASEMASLTQTIKQKQETLNLQAGINKNLTEATQETKSKTLELEKAKAEAEAKKKVEESKQKQTEAELKAKKIFFSIMASGLVLASAGYAIFRR